LQQLEQVANLSTYPSKRFNSFCYDDDDDEDYTVVITPEFSITDSLIMENEHLDTILETESDEFIKSSVENLSRSQVSSRIFPISKMNVICPIVLILKRQIFQRLPILSSTILPLVMTSQVMRRPRFYSENDRFDTKSYLLESLLNRDTLIASSPKFDSFIEEFFSELTHIDLIPPGINEAFYDDHVTEISSGSTTTYSDSSLYDSFIFDLSINLFPPADRSIFMSSPMNSLTSYLHQIMIVSTSRLNPTRGDFTMDVVEDTFPTKEQRVHNALTTHPTFQLNLDFILSSESFFAYVVWIFLFSLIFSCSLIFSILRE
nr:hypothetical protein [Tanacetum cinerariifolium]